MIIDGSNACGEHSIPYRQVESLCCIPETKLTLCTSFIEIKKF